MDGKQLKDDVHAGRIDIDRLIDLLISSQQRLHSLNQQLENANQQLENANQQLENAQQRIAELEKLIPGGAPPAKVAEPFSTRAEEKRQEARGQKKRQKKKPRRQGRCRNKDKIKLAERTETIYPAGIPVCDCWLSHVRPVWRFENGRAVLVAYEIYCGPGNKYGKIPGVVGRGEYGLEILVTIAYLAYLVYVAGLSFDKVCAVLGFLQNLKLSKAQADALLHQLARHWQLEFEVLCTLLANSLVVHTDETSWSLNSVWAFLSEKARLLLFGVHKDAETLKLLLDPDTFLGLVISDDYAVYANFTAAQKCWAHLLRKGIKLTLQAPENKTYRWFLDQLLAIYRQACRAKSDGRLSAAGRQRRVAALDDALCWPLWGSEPLSGLDDDFRLEVIRLVLNRQLFQFVTAEPVPQPNGETKPVGATNNEAERTLRGPAQARKTGRTNKTPTGARRQTILTSVLESLRLYLTTFTLTAVLAEIQRWTEAGASCFTELLKKLKLSPPKESVLDRLIPIPDG